LRNVFKNLSRSEFVSYIFPDASELIPESKVPPEEETGEETSPENVEPVPEEEEEQEQAPDPSRPLDYAQFQADVILRDARRQAEEELALARQEARAEAESIRQNAREEGHQEGYREGYAQGEAEGKAEGLLRCEERASAMEAEVQRFFDHAESVLDRQLDDNIGQLRDLAIAIAEKVIGVSLRSSSEVIGRMVQAAVDKRKAKDWVRIYIAECDAKRMGQVPASLTSALAGLSDRVRIIPIADDEPGTCIIEMPDEIIDASTSTQISNIRAMLSSRQSEPDIFHFSF